MPVFSMFYGLLISMYYLDNKQHNLPHIHVKYNDEEAVFSIPEGLLIACSIPKNKIKLVQAWIELRQEDLKTDWSLAIIGEPIFKIDPLR